MAAVGGTRCVAVENWAASQGMSVELLLPNSKALLEVVVAVVGEWLAYGRISDDIFVADVVVQ